MECAMTKSKSVSQKPKQWIVAVMNRSTQKLTYLPVMAVDADSAKNMVMEVCSGVIVSCEVLDN